MADNEKRKGPRWTLIKYLARTPLRIASPVSALVGVPVRRALPTPVHAGRFGRAFAASVEVTDPVGAV